MIDFKEEIAKYKRIMEIDEVEESLGNEIKDIMDLLQHLITVNKSPKAPSK